MSDTPCTAFDGTHRIASGPLAEVAVQTRAWMDQHPDARILIFDDVTARPIDVDFRGSEADIRRRLAAPVAPRSPGRPKLGVVAREVTLLPRHWEWLGIQPGGASVALRKLVEDARRGTIDRRQQMRHAQEACYRFMQAMAGDAPDFEEATRAMYRNLRGRFTTLVRKWPKDVAEHTLKLAVAAFPTAEEMASGNAGVNPAGEPIPGQS